MDKKLMQMIARIAECETDLVTLDAELGRDLGMDSMMMIDLVVQSEKEYGVSVDEDRVAGLKTVRDVLGLIVEEGIKAVLESFRKPGMTDAVMTLETAIVDSLDMMKFLVALEDRFDVYIDESFLETSRLRDLAYVRDAVLAAVGHVAA